MNADVLIIGGGVAGLKTAADLAGYGIGSAVLEKGLFTGGQAAHLPCKATDECARCNACLLEDTLAEHTVAEGSRIYTNAEIVSLAAEGGGFKAVVRSGPVCLSPDKCTDCGLCFDACPEKGRALKRAKASGASPAYALDMTGCLRQTGQDCRLCAEACPAGAIDLGAVETQTEFTARAVVAACGFRPFDPAEKPRYGHDLYPDVISAIELDAMLRETGSLARPSDGRTPTNVAFIQCVGSRDKSIGRDYCSRVCCGYALRLSALIRHRLPETQVSLFYMDLQNTGRDFDRFLDRVRGGVELVHGVPGEITAGKNGGLLLPYVDETTGRRTSREVELVVLSLGLGPPEPDLAERLGYKTDTDGFLLEDQQSGRFVAGAAAGPMNVAESRGQGAACAARVLRYVKKS